jgi:hypothetical protein
MKIFTNAMEVQFRKTAIPIGSVIDNDAGVGSATSQIAQRIDQRSERSQFSRG